MRGELPTFSWLPPFNETNKILVVVCCFLSSIKIGNHAGVRFSSRHLYSLFYFYSSSFTQQTSIVIKKNYIHFVENNLEASRISLCLKLNTTAVVLAVVLTCSVLVVYYDFLVGFIKPYEYYNAILDDHSKNTELMLVKE